MEKTYLFIVNNQGMGGLAPHNPAFDLPRRRLINGVVYVKTDRTRTIDNVSHPVYVQDKFKLDINNFADPIAESEAQEKPALEVDLDNIMEDLIVGHNFDYARKALLEWHYKHLDRPIA